MAKRAGVLNVDRWLDTVTPRQFDEWVAFDKLEPDEMVRQRDILTRGLVCLANSWGADLKMSDIDVHYEEPNPEEVSPAELERRMKERY